MSDSKIIKAATTNHSADYVIILERKTDYHPITGRGSHFVEVRVIKPINDITRGPNLDELLAKEVEKEQASTGPAGAVVSTETQTPPSASAPNSVAQPAAVATPAPTQNIDPNSIAL